MKVRMTVTIDVDEDVYELEYGVSREELRENVRSYVLNALQCSAAGDSGAFRDVVLR